MDKIVKKKYIHTQKHIHTQWVMCRRHTALILVLLLTTADNREGVSTLSTGKDHNQGKSVERVLQETGAN